MASPLALALPPTRLPDDVPVERSTLWCWWPAGALIATRPESPSPQLLAWLEEDRRQRWQMWRGIARDDLDRRGEAAPDAAAISRHARALALGEAARSDGGAS